MKTRIAVAATGLMLGVAPISSAMAFTSDWTGRSPRDVTTTGSLVGIGIHDLPSYEAHPGYCAPSSAAEGNANQQTRPVKQYGQTTGGNRC